MEAPITIYDIGRAVLDTGVAFPSLTDLAIALRLPMRIRGGDPDETHDWLEFSRTLTPAEFWSLANWSPVLGKLAIQAGAAPEGSTVESVDDLKARWDALRSAYTTEVQK